MRGKLTFVATDATRVVIGNDEGRQLWRDQTLAAVPRREASAPVGSGCLSVLAQNEHRHDICRVLHERVGRW